MQEKKFWMVNLVVHLWLLPIELVKKLSIDTIKSVNYRRLYFKEISKILNQ